MDDQLFLRLLPDDVRKLLEKMLKSKKWFLSITYFKPKVKNDLQHVWITENFPIGNLLKSIEKIKEDVIKKHGLNRTWI